MLTVLTVTIPGREALLAENIASVYAQAIPVRQLICAHKSAGEPMVQYSAAKNDMLRAVTTDWVAVLNDDDYWLPNHLEAIAPELEHADVVYTWEASGNKPRENCNEWSRERLRATWETTNFLDGNCAFRTDLLRRVGGFPVNWTGPGPWAGGHYEGSPARFEDWELFRRLCPLGAKFRCVPEETWVYRVGTPGQICG
jgi:hypothetical protein